MFYKTGPEDFVYVFKYGVVCFLNYDAAARDAAFAKRIIPYSKGNNVFEQPLSEEFEVETNARENKFGYNKIGRSRQGGYRSIAADHVECQSECFAGFTTPSKPICCQWKKPIRIPLKAGSGGGRLDISGANLKKYIGGKTLNR